MSTSIAEAAYRLEFMVEDENRGWGERPEAINTVAKACRTSFWTVNNILIGRKKSVDGDLKERIRTAFIDHCRGHAARLLREAETAAKDNNNDAIRAVESEIRALASKLAAAKGEATRTAQ